MVLFALIVLVIDLSSGSDKRLDSHGANGDDGCKNFAVSLDGKIGCNVAHSGALTRIFRISISGADVPAQLLTVIGTVWNLESGQGGSLYANMVDRPVDVVRFAPDGTRVERLASFPQVPDLTSMTVLPDGRAVLPVRASSLVRLMAVQKGKDPALFGKHH